MKTHIKAGLENFPRTRFMGSKQKLLHFIHENVKNFDFETVLDAFNGSASVGYLFKVMGKQVHTNDFLKYSYIIAKATIENNNVKLTKNDVNFILNSKQEHNQFISKTFKNIYFEDDDNIFLDQTLANIMAMTHPMKNTIALSALARACVKKRPRGIFTYTGNRYDDGRRDLRLSLKEQFLESIETINKSVFDNKKKNKSFNTDVFKLKKSNYDLVYIDPPYCSIHSDNDYSRRYHFVEGLMSNWSHVIINPNTKTKKFDKFPTPFDSKKTVYEAFDKLFAQFNKSIILVSYSSNSLPNMKEMIDILSRHKKNVKVKKCAHKYSFGNQSKNLNNNKVEEYLFIGTD